LLLDPTLRQYTRYIVITSIKNAEHYKWQGLCDAWHLLKSDALSIKQERMPPGTSERYHFHEHSEQIFFILESEAEFNVDGRAVSLKKWESIHIRPGVKHRIMNKSSQDLHFLVISRPDPKEDRVLLDD
jgi:mannose-6-phosphate isomerase-like protein (cupin superfamily)